MFILDTNVLLELMRDDPDARVLEWAAGQRVDQLFTTAVSQAEVLSGLAIMPEGRRREMLVMAARAMFLDDFAGRVLPFDAVAAEAYAGIFTGRRRVGRPISGADLMIASIASTRGGTVATRDRGGFSGCGVAVVDPWDAA
ncbi:MAG: type II toxin-antitoxin system VapC family toxin [Acetobacteraceae bacterium]|nr:type II toxin-antitoxin system VapC family toxin [Acetobacteraceae bacterium]